MSAWRRELLSQFPEFEHAPESWTLIDAQMELASVLERAARAGDRATGARVLKFVIWAVSQSDEQFIYFCHTVLRPVVTSASLRSYFVSLLNERTFGRLAPYIEYLAPKAVVKEMAEELRLGRHAG